MKERVSLLLILSALLVGLGWYVLQSRDLTAPQPGADIAGNRTRVTEWKGPKHGEQSADVALMEERIGAALPEGAANENELIIQIAQLTAAVDRLEKTANNLDARIMRSRLAVPGAEERKTQLLRGEERLDALKKAAEAKTAKAQSLARALGYEVHVIALLQGKIPEALENNAEFVAALDEAQSEQRVIKHFEKQLSELRFSTAVEALTE